MSKYLDGFITRMEKEERPYGVEHHENFCVCGNKLHFVSSKTTCSCGKVHYFENGRFKTIRVFGEEIDLRRPPKIYW